MLFRDGERTIMDDSSGEGEPQLKESKEVMPLNTWVLISNLKVAYTLSRNADGTFNRNLAEYLDRKVPFSSSPLHQQGDVTFFDVTMSRATGLWSRIFIHQEANYVQRAAPHGSRPIFFYFHGGSFVHSTADSAVYHTVCQHLARLCRAVVISVNYRRAPEHKFPAAYDDGHAALRWLSSQVQRGLASTWLPRDVDTARCFLVGDSSGGNIVHHVGLRAAAGPPLPGIRIAGHILIIPMFGGQRRTQSELRFDGQYFVTIKDRDYYWQSFLPDGADRDHPACNIFGPNSESLAGVQLPPSLVAVAELDMLKEWQLEYVDGMKAAGKGVELLFLEEATVGFFILPNTQHFHRLMDSIRGFISGTMMTGSELASSDPGSELLH